MEIFVLKNCTRVLEYNYIFFFFHFQIRTILDLDCGYGSYGAHLSSYQLLTMCLANYEASGSQVQLTLERGLPAMIGSFTTRQLPYPSLSFDMIHCARCRVDWDTKGTLDSVTVSVSLVSFFTLLKKLLEYHRENDTFQI